MDYLVLVSTFERPGNLDGDAIDGAPVHSAIRTDRHDDVLKISAFNQLHGTPTIGTLFTRAVDFDQIRVPHIHHAVHGTNKAISVRVVRGDRGVHHLDHDWTSVFLILSEKQPACATKVCDAIKLEMPHRLADKGVHAFIDQQHVITAFE